jgi:hypothetical protein
MWLMTLNGKLGYTQVGMRQIFSVIPKPRFKTYVGIEVSNVKCGLILKSREIIH